MSLITTLALIGIGAVLWHLDRKVAELLKCYQFIKTELVKHNQFVIKKNLSVYALLEERLNSFKSLIKKLENFLTPAEEADSEKPQKEPTSADQEKASH